jgi:hypothetical protein
MLRAIPGQAGQKPFEGANTLNPSFYQQDRENGYKLQPFLLDQAIKTTGHSQRPQYIGRRKLWPECNIPYEKPLCRWE